MLASTPNLTSPPGSASALPSPPGLLPPTLAAKSFAAAASHWATRRPPPPPWREAERRREEEAERRREQEETWREAEWEARRIPNQISDTRFDKERRHRGIRCDGCRELKQGNAVGTFAALSRRWLAPACRREAWERGEWNASWYCVECYADYWECELEEVKDYLGFSRRRIEKEEFMAARAARASAGPSRPAKRKTCKDNRRAV